MGIYLTSYRAVPSLGGKMVLTWCKSPAAVSTTGYCLTLRLDDNHDQDYSCDCNRYDNLLRFI